MLVSVKGRAALTSGRVDNLSTPGPLSPPIADFIGARIDAVSSTDSLGTPDCSAVAGEGEDVGATGGDANR